MITPSQHGIILTIHCVFTFKNMTRWRKSASALLMFTLEVSRMLLNN